MRFTAGLLALAWLTAVMTGRAGCSETREEGGGRERAEGEARAEHTQTQSDAGRVRDGRQDEECDCVACVVVVVGLWCGVVQAEVDAHRNVSPAVAVAVALCTAPALHCTLHVALSTTPPHTHTRSAHTTLLPTSSRSFSSRSCRLPRGFRCCLPPAPLLRPAAFPPPALTAMSAQNGLSNKGSEAGGAGASSTPPASGASSASAAASASSAAAPSASGVAVQGEEFQRYLEKSGVIDALTKGHHTTPSRSTLHSHDSARLTLASSPPPLPLAVLQCWWGCTRAQRSPATPSSQQRTPLHTQQGRD